MRYLYWEFVLTLSKGVVGTLFGLSILTATIRTTYRIQTQGRLLLDDFVLLFACVTLTAATGLVFVLVPTIYWLEEIIFNPNLNNFAAVGLEEGLFARVLRDWRQIYAFVSLTWAAIFSVKICFLLFFLQLVDRQKNMIFICKTFFVIILIVFCFCVCRTYVACPHFGQNLGCKSSFFSQAPQCSRNNND